MPDDIVTRVQNIEIKFFELDLRAWDRALEQIPTRHIYEWPTWKFEPPVLSSADRSQHTRQCLLDLAAIAPESVPGLEQWVAHLISEGHSAVKLPPEWHKAKKGSETKTALARYIAAATTEMHFSGKIIGIRTCVRTAWEKLNLPAGATGEGFWTCPHCAHRVVQLSDNFGSSTTVPATLSCPNCSHKASILSCDCAKCQELLRPYAETLQVAARAAIAQIEQKLSHARLAAPRVGTKPIFPSDSEAQRDYISGRENLSLTLRKTLALAPLTTIEFVNYATRCTAGPLGSHRTRLDNLLLESRQHHVLYRRVAVESAYLDAISDAEVIDQVKLTALLSCCRFVAGARPDQLLPLFYQKCADLVIPPSPFIHEQLQHKIRYFAAPASNEYWLTLPGAVYLQMNRHFQRQAISPPATRAACTLFRSQSEMQTYSRLLSENPGAVVVPNRKLHQVVPIAAYSHLDSYARQYLSSCELSFAVYSNTGMLLFVEELLQENHTDTPDWQHKDGLKRRAVEHAGIVYRESFS